MLVCITMWRFIGLWVSGLHQCRTGEFGDLKASEYTRHMSICRESQSELLWNCVDCNLLYLE
jgi:hypothetical protein